MAQAFDAARMAENVAAIRHPGEIALCAVCKTRTGETIRQSAALPVDLFGENHMQELITHFDEGDYLGKPVHFIGHLQINKVKKVVGRAAVIESVDSLRLMEAIEKEAAKQSLRQDILLEINIGAVEQDRRFRRGTLPPAGGRSGHGAYPCPGTYGDPPRL